MNIPELIQRQRRFLEEAGATPAEALAKLQKHAPAGTVGASLDGPQDGLSTYLDSCATKLGPHRRAIEGAIREFLRESNAALRPVWRSIRAVALHFAAITGFAWIVVAMMTIYVLPQFETVFSGFGADLPAFTRMILTPLPRILMLALLTAIAIALFWIPRRMQVASLLEQPVPASALSGLMLGPVHQEYFTVLGLAVARAGVRSGMPADAALEFARHFVAHWSKLDLPPHLINVSQLNPLQLAGQLGTLEAELDYQIAQRWYELPLHASERREWLALAASVILGLCIGALIVALYLPIFKLASVI